MRTSAIVVSYRPHKWLEPSLRSVLDQADEVVLVDNGSAGTSIGTTGRRLGAQVRRLESNRGFAGGVNAGLKAATGDIVAVLNDDAVAEPHWISNAATALVSSDVAAVAPKVLFTGRYAELRLADESHHAPGDHRPLGRQIFHLTVDGRDALAGALGAIHRMEEGAAPGEPRRWRWTSGRQPLYIPLPDKADDADIRVNGERVTATWTGDLVNNAGSYLSAEGHGGDYGFETPDDGRFDAVAERFAVTGAAMVSRAETFRQLGGLAGRFFAYYEDLDWSWRARLAGLRVLYEPSGVVRHARSVTSGGPDAPIVRLLAARNRILCLARNAPLRFMERQLAKDWRDPPVPTLRRSLLRHLPAQLLERQVLARRWTARPAEVLERWAGVDERWDLEPPH